MTPLDPEDPVDRFVEEVALAFEQGGLARIAGRILGLLLVADPPHRSSAELAEALGASKGSVSTMTRMLLRLGLLERVAIPGERSTHFRLAADGFARLFEGEIVRIVAFRQLADDGLTRLSGLRPEGSLQRLRDLRDLYAFFEREMPALIERWHAERARSEDG